MITVKARFDGRAFIPEQPIELPVGTIVEFSFAEPVTNGNRPLLPLAEIARVFPEDPNWPEDGAAQHDHYLYGMPKRP